MISSRKTGDSHVLAGDSSVTLSLFHKNGEFAMFEDIFLTAERHTHVLVIVLSATTLSLSLVYLIISLCVCCTLNTRNHGNF